MAKKQTTEGGAKTPAPKEEPVAKTHDDVIEQLLALEADATEAARDHPAGDNSDAVKAGLTNAAHGIAHIRKALDQVARLAR